MSGRNVIGGLCLTVLVAILLAPASAGAQVLPAFRSPMIETPATIASYWGRLNQGTGTQGPSTSDADIAELARGLKYDPGLMYKFVHDHIRFTPTWGETKGAYMTWMDRSGNAFDQATLLVALLTQAAANGGNGHTITNIQYGVGEITPTVEQFTSWFAIANEARIAREVLARGGFYADVSPSTGTGSITSITMVHAWVRATIDGVTRSFDPSFKSHHVAYGILNLGTAMSYDSTDFLTDAQRAGGGYNTAAIRENLDTYSTSLVNYIKTHDVNDALEDIIGDKRIVPVDESALPPQYLPYSSTLRHNFAISAIRSIYRTTLRVQHCGIDQTLYSSNIYGRRLSIKYNASNQPQLILDGTVLATGTACTLGQEYDVILTVDHPYEVTDFDAATTLKIKAGGFYQVVNGWGNTGTKILLKYRGLLQDYKLAGSSDTSEEVLGESYAIVGLTWLAKTSAMRNMAAETVDSTITNHHVLGIAGQYDAPYTDLGLAHWGVVDHASVDRPEEMFRVLVAHAAAYEHEVIRNLQNCNAVSGPRLLETANNRTTYNSIYGASSFNWTSVQSQLVNYSQAEKDRISTYITAGFSAAVPQYGDLTEDSWTGIGFRARQTTTGTYSTYAMAYIVGGGYKGGASCTSGSLSPATLLDTCVGAASDGDPEGAYGTGSTDIAIGNGGFPFGLAFGRQYSSHRRAKDGPLGLGWTHNLDISAKVLSDSWQLLGADSATDAAAHIVSLKAAKGVDGTDDMIAPLCANWLMDKMRDNVVDVKQGSSTMRFVKKADGTYQAPTGQAIKLTTQTNGNFRLKNSKGIFYDFDSTGKLDEWSDAFGNKVDFSYTSGKLSQVASKIGGTTTSRTLSFTYTGDRITTVTDSASRTISYTYDAYGQLTQFTNPDGNNVQYGYDATKRGRITRLYSPVDLVNPKLTVVYDTVGRQKQITDANNCTWDYYNATYRREVLEPSQLAPDGVVRRYSTITWANPEARKIISKDQLGRTTTSEYNGQSQIVSVTNPSGTSAEYAYDENNNVVQRGDFCIPGSSHSDPNVYHYYNYHECTNTDGRWFVHMKKQTNPAGQITLYYYDYNEPTPPSRLGKLLKIIYPPVDPPTDPNRLQELFTYNSFGQLENKTGTDGIVARQEYYTAAEGAGLKKTIVDYSTSGGHLNITTEYTYDSVGRVATIKDPLGNVSTKEYYASGLLKKTTGPSCCGSSNVSYEYYADGKLKYTKQVSSGSFVDDPACVAWWRLENGALTADSKGSNTLTNSGVTSYTSDYREGSGCGDFEWSEQDCLHIADASLSSGFPLKTGDTNKKISVTAWVKFESMPGYGGGYNIWSKCNGDGGANKWCLQLLLYNDDGAPNFVISHGYNGGASHEDVFWTAGIPVIGRWYFIAYTYQDSDKSYRLHVWDATNNQRLGGAASDVTGAMANNINVEDVAWYLGGREGNVWLCLDGLLDNVIVFNDILTATEIDQIRQSTYSGSSAQTIYLSAITYNSRGLKATERGPYPEGATPSELAVNYTQYFYDNLGRMWRVVDAEANENRTRYYPDGKIWKVIDAENHNAVVNTYNADGSLQKVADGKGNETIYTYNGFEGTKRTTYPGGTYEEPTYDSYRRVTQNRMRGGQKIQLAYDNLDRVKTKTVKDAADTTVNTITYKYDRAGRLLRTTDNIGTTRNTYDNAGRLTQVAYPGGRTVAYQYDAASNRTRLTYPDSTYVTYEYDAMNRLRIVRNQSGTILAQYNFDWRSRRESLSYANGARIDYLYDVANRVISVDNIANSGSHEYAYGYDNVGNRTSMTVTNGGTEVHQYVYDGTYQVKEVDYPAGYGNGFTDTEFNYDAAGNRTAVIDASGTTTYQSNSLNQYSSVGGLAYTYDTSGNMTYDGDGQTYGYDPENRLTTVQKVPEPLAAACDIALAFTTSGAANWFSQTAESYNDNDAVQSGGIGDDQETVLEATVPGTGTVTFWWKTSTQVGDEAAFYIDGVWKAGRSGISGWNSVSQTITTAGTHTLRWKYMKDSSGSSGSDCIWVDYVQWTGTMPSLGSWSTIAYTYDANGRRIEKKVDGTTQVKYVYDGDHIIAEYDGSNSLLRKYIHGQGIDEPICMIEASGTYAGTQYYHYDALGSVVGLTNSAGNMVELYEYSVYGQVAASDAAHPNRFMFTGREFDKDAGLYYYRARYYNPEIGRFLQTDPVGYNAGMNLYWYCRNNTINMVDPDGLFAKKIVREIVKGIAGPGRVTIQPSCSGCPITILPEDSSKGWIANPDPGAHKIDAIAFYTPDGNAVVMKIPNGCSADVNCPNKKTVVISVKCNYYQWPSQVDPAKEGFPPVPPREEIGIKEPE